MGFRAASMQIRTSRVAGCFAMLVLCLWISMRMQSQAVGNSASLRGRLRDSKGKAVAGATIDLQAKDSTQLQIVHTDTQGNYSFEKIGGGVYTLRAEMAGYSSTQIPSIFVGPTDAKRVDLILLSAGVPPSPSVSTEAPQFFDEPHFAVAGVTDTTNLGGHGSDTIVRTWETLAKETVSLSKKPAPPPAVESEKEKALREKVERDPHSFEANHLLGKVLDEDGKASQAIPYLDRAAGFKPNDYENSYDQALALAHAGSYEQAREHADALVTVRDTAELHHLLGDVQEKLGNSLGAVREYQRAAELEPREAYLFDWGSELLLHHAPEPAVEVFTKGNRLFPRSARMLIGLGAASFARGSYDEAVQRICEASDLDPSDSIPYLFLGKMQSAESATAEKIVERLRRFVTEHPDSADANYYYAVSLWKMREGSQDISRRTEIESLLEKAIHLDAQFAAAHLQMGILQSEQKNYPRAISEYAQAIQADPKMEEAHYRLARAYRQIGDPRKAEAELQLCEAISKESAQQRDRERHEIKQFVYILRDQAPAQIP
jgi:tetratricopeptide (TPR) repeat protein